MDGSAISQTIPILEGGCFYELSFFAHAEGAQVSLLAELIFETSDGEVAGGTINIRAQDIPNSNRDFGYYTIISDVAPSNATVITIRFTVTANGMQSLDLDGVSLIVS